MKTPWGEWQVLLEEPDYKVKRITVAPGQRMSYQKHLKRREHWLIVKGAARVTLNGEVRELAAGETADIETGTSHRIENPGREPLVFVEIQMGSYFGEDDIIRLEDDYGRAGEPQTGTAGRRRG